MKKSLTTKRSKKMNNLTTENNSLESLESQENQALQAIETQEKAVLTDEEILEKCQISFDFDSEENEQSLENKGVATNEETTALLCEEVATSELTTATTQEATTTTATTQATTTTATTQATTQTTEINTIEMLETQGNQALTAEKKQLELREKESRNFSISTIEKLQNVMHSLENDIQAIRENNRISQIDDDVTSYDISTLRWYVKTIYQFLQDNVNFSHYHLKKGYIRFKDYKECGAIEALNAWQAFQIAQTTAEQKKQLLIVLNNLNNFSLMDYYEYGKKRIEWEIDQKKKEQERSWYSDVKEWCQKEIEELEKELESLKNQALQPIETQENQGFSSNEESTQESTQEEDTQETIETTEINTVESSQNLENQPLTAIETSEKQEKQVTTALLSSDEKQEETTENNTLDSLEILENQGNASNEESQEAIATSTQETEKTTDFNSENSEQSEQIQGVATDENLQPRFYGYAMVTTHTQSTEMQERHILNYCTNAKIYVDKLARKKDSQVEFDKMYKHLKTHGGCVICDSIRNLARTADGAFEKYKLLFNNKIELIFLQESHLNTAFYYDLLSKQETTEINTVKSVLLATIENIIKGAFTSLYKRKKAHADATAKGIETAKSNGAKIGNQKGERRQPKEKAKNLRRIKSLSQFFNGSLSDYELAKKLGITRQTVIKYRNELREMEKNA